VQPKDIDAILAQTLQDRRLTGGEKTVLARFLEDIHADEQKRGFCRHRAFEIARSAVADPDSARVLEWLEDVIKLTQPKSGAEKSAGKNVADACFGPGDACPNRITYQLNHARRKVDICVFTITDDRIANAILTAHKRKVAVRVITDNEKADDPGSDIERLREAGIPLKMDDTPYHMHHKFAVFDDELMLTGSYNWTRNAAMVNWENIIVTSEPALVKAFTVEFDRLWTSLK
jgi:phosphatidylserine/phosphatidylglycerophosphate/cardiolipin synthase-like enzyme